MTPIILTAYNRWDTLCKTLHSLRMCTDFSKTPLLVYSDGGDVRKVRNGLKLLQNYLPNLEVIERTKNIGLKANSIGAILETFNKYDKCILIPDDVEVSRDFILFHNWALREYEENPDIMFTMGYSPFNDEPIYKTRKLQEGVGLWEAKFPMLTCDIKTACSDKKEMKAFGKIDSAYPDMLKSSMYGLNQSWMIMLNYEMFTQNKFCISPGRNKVRHIFTDSENCKEKDKRKFNQKLNEGWDNIPYKDTGNKWNIFKKTTRFLKHSYYKFKYET